MITQCGLKKSCLLVDSLKILSFDLNIYTLISISLKFASKDVCVQLNGSGDNLLPNRQTITWNNADQDTWSHKVFIGHNTMS